MSTNKLSLVLGLALLSAPALSKITKISNDNDLTYNITVDGLKTEKVALNGEEFQKLNLLGVEEMMAIHYIQGTPQVPVLRFYANADKMSDIEVTTIENKTITSQTIQNILPVLPSLEKIPGSTYQESDLNLNKAFITENEFSIEDAGSMRGQQRYLVTLYPVALEGNKAIVKNQFQVKIKNPSINFIPMEAPEGIVFIIGSKFKDAPSLVKYMELKKNLGFNVFTLDVKKEDPDQIRLKIKDLYAKNPSLKYALIVGDSEDVPGKESTIIAGTTDLYYAALGNEYEEDLNAPDLFIGRVTAEDKAGMNKIFNKMITYLNDSYSTQSMLDHISFIATDDRYEVAEETHNYVINTYTKKAKYRGVFPKANQPGGDKLYAISHKAWTNEVMNAISQGRTIINYSGHGSTDSWAGPYIGQEEVRSLKSTTFPFVISNACITGDFRIDESFAETWIRHENGAIMFFGSMDSSYWDEDDILEKRMFDGIFTKNKENFGEITDYGLSEMWRQYGGENRSKYYRETYHMFGDPSLKLKISPF
jgi:gingipain R